MLKLILSEMRRTVGHTLQLAVVRLLATPVGLSSAQGDLLTQIGRQFGVDRETDAQYRQRVETVARRRTGPDAQYRPPAGQA